MEKFSKFKSIGQFRNVVKDYNSNYNRTWNEEKQEVEFDTLKPKETLTFTGTVKVHGSNASVMMTSDGRVRAGKRTSFIENGSNELNGLGIFIAQNEEILKTLITEIKNVLGLSPEKEVVLYGEWAGGNIQKGVAVSGLDKFFYVFDFKVIGDSEDGNRYFNCTEWFRDMTMETVEKCLENKIIFAPQVYERTIDIDMGNPMLATEELEKLTLAVEKHCPVGDFFGSDGIGEGIVWTHKKPDGAYFTYKTKGQLHSVSNVTKLVSIAPEILKKQSDFVDLACTENRMVQGIQEIYGSVEECIERDKRIGKFVNWVKNDILKEELDVMKENNIQYGSVAKQIANKCNGFLFSTMDKNVMG